MKQSIFIMYSFLLFNSLRAAMPPIDELIKERIEKRNIIKNSQCLVDRYFLHRVISEQGKHTMVGDGTTYITQHEGIVRHYNTMDGSLIEESEPLDKHSHLSKLPEFNNEFWYEHVLFFRSSFFPSSNTLITASSAGKTIKCYNVPATCECAVIPYLTCEYTVIPWEEQDREIKMVSVSPDGDSIIAYIDNKTKNQQVFSWYLSFMRSQKEEEIKIWKRSKNNYDPVIIQRASSPFSAPGSINCMTCDNRYLYIGSDYLEQYSLDTGRLVCTYRVGPVFDLEFSPAPHSFGDYFFVISENFKTFILISPLILSKKQLDLLVDFNNNYDWCDQKCFEMLSLIDQKEWNAIPSCFTQEIQKHNSLLGSLGSYAFTYKNYV